MPLRLLPDMLLPVTQAQVNPLMENVAQLNILDGALSDRVQRALGLYLHTFDLWVKSKGRIDYRGKAGHARLVEDAMRFCGPGNPVATRHGDLAAAHLSIDFHDTQTRCMVAGLPLLSTKVSDLTNACSDLVELSPEMDKRLGLLMDYLGKRPLV